MTAPDRVIATLDVGTSRVKGALFAPKGGAALSTHVRQLPPLVVNGWRAEQRLDDLTDAIGEVLASMGAAVSTDKWVTLALATQRGTLIVGDASGQARPMMFSWLDRRGLEVGGERPGDRWDWLAKNKQAPVAQGRIWSLASWLLERLTGEALDTAATQSPDLDVGRHPEQKALKLPRIVAAGTLRPLRARGATTWDLPNGLPIILVGGDKNAELIGSGIIEPGDAAVSLGTAISMGMLAPLDAKGGFAFRTPSLIAGLGQWEVGLPNGGAVPHWAQRVLAATGAGSIPCAPEAPTFVPYLEGSLAYPKARGAWLGLTTNVTAVDLDMATLEGLVLDLRRQRQELPLPIRRLRLVGGDSGEMRIAKALADALQVPVAFGGVADAGLVGSAMTAGVTLGLVRGWVDAASAWAPLQGNDLLPDPARAPAWDGRYARFSRFVAALEAVSG